MSNTFIGGAKYALSGFKLIFKPRLRRFVIIPFLINLILFSGALWFGSQWIDAFIDNLLPGWLEWLSFIIWPLLAITALVIIFSTFTMVANVLGAPFNSMLAEAVETRLSDQKIINNPKLTSLTKDTLLSFKSEIWKLIFFGIRAIPLLILFIIPGLNIAAPVLWFLFVSWMLVHQYMDYPMDNNGLKFSQQRPLLKKKRMMIFGFGVTVMILTLVPVLNFFAMPVAVSGATFMWYEQFKEGSTA